MAQFHLNMYEVFFIRSWLVKMLKSRLFGNGTYRTALHELRGLGLLEVACIASRSEHMLDLNNTFAKFEGQIPLVVVVQGAVMFAKIS